MAEVTGKTVARIYPALTAMIGGHRFTRESAFVKGTAASNNDTLTVPGINPINIAILSYRNSTVPVQYTIAGNVITLVNGAGRTVEGMVVGA